VGYDEHGRWSLFPTPRVRENRRHYDGVTMILETEFACDGGVARIIDFMAVSGRCDVVRIIEGRRRRPTATRAMQSDEARAFQIRVHSQKTHFHAFTGAKLSPAWRKTF
jgi:hypothetical protein